MLTQKQIEKLAMEVLKEKSFGEKLEDSEMRNIARHFALRVNRGLEPERALKKQEQTSSFRRSLGNIQFDI